MRNKSKTGFILIPQQGRSAEVTQQRETKTQVGNTLLGGGGVAKSDWQELTFTSVSQLAPQCHSSAPGPQNSGDRIRKLFKTKGNQVWWFRARVREES